MQRQLRRYHCIDALEILIVFEPNLDVRGQRRRWFWVYDRVGQIEFMDRLEIAADRLGDKGPGAVDPSSSRSGPPARDISAKTRWNLNAGRNVAACEPLLKVGVIN